MEGQCLTGQSPQWAVVPMEEEEDKKKKKDNNTNNNYKCSLMGEYEMHKFLIFYLLLHHNLMIFWF